jgi:hypothetical protein
VRSLFSWRLDEARFSSPGVTRAPAAGSSVERDPSLRVTSRDATTIDLEIGASPGPRIFRLGEAWDDRWTLSIDGHDAGKPLVVDGYATGWRIDGSAHHLEARFGPQFAVKATFEMSLAAAVGLVGVVLLPVSAAEVLDRWRRPATRSPAGRPAAGAPPRWRRRPQVRDRRDRGRS